jgi:hypothetical protein
MLMQRTLSGNLDKYVPSKAVFYYGHPFHYAFNEVFECVCVVACNERLKVLRLQPK